MSHTRELCEQSPELGMMHAIFGLTELQIGQDFYFLMPHVIINCQLVLQLNENNLGKMPASDDQNKFPLLITEHQTSLEA